MKWFNKWFFKKCDRWSEQRFDSPMACEVETSIPSNRFVGDYTTFNMYRANGGTVVEVIPRRQDYGINKISANDRPSIYVIPDDQSLMDGLQRIITFDALSR